MDAYSAASISSDTDSDMDEFETNSKSCLSSEKYKECMDIITLTRKEPMNYDHHIQCINVLQNAGMKNELRMARQLFHENFPLSENYWLQWLEDEKLEVDSNEDYEPLFQLYEQSLEDYLSVALWISYINTKWTYVKEIESSDSNIEDLRQLCEKAVSYVGFHFTQGFEVWKLYREIEKEELEKLVSQNDVDQKKLIEQESRLRDLYVRQLEAPMEGDSVISEFRAWSQYNIREGKDKSESAFLNAEKKFNENKAACKDMNLYERRLISVQDPQTLVKIWIQYINYEIDTKNKNRIHYIFERAVASLCLSHELWEKYVEYAVLNLDQTANANSICKRALRNTPWSGKLWYYHLICLEKSDESIEVIENVQSKALSTPLSSAEHYLELLMLRCDYYRRKMMNWSDEDSKLIVDENSIHTLGQKLKNSLNEGIKLLGDLYPTWEEGLLKIYRYQIFCETYVFKDHDVVWNCFDNIIRKYGKNLNVWVSCITYYKDKQQYYRCRSLFKRALQNVKDYPESIISLWLDFEREVGTLEQWQEAKARCLKEEKSIAQMRRKQATIERHSIKDSPKKSMENRKKFGKRNKEYTSPKRKRQRLDSNKTKHIHKQPPRTGEDVEMTETVNVSKPTPITNEKVTLFLWKLPRAVTSDNLREHFEKYGKISDIRLIVKKSGSGRSRGFAYIEFDKEESATAALSQEDHLLLDQKINVERYKPTVANPLHGTEGSWKTHPQTIYVSGLHEDLRDQKLLDTFKEYGEIVDAVVKLKKNGESQQYGLVQFVDQKVVNDLVRKELIKLDNNDIRIERSRISAVELRKGQMDTLMKRKTKKFNDTKAPKPSKAPNKTKTFNSVITQKSLEQSTSKKPSMGLFAPRSIKASSKPRAKIVKPSSNIRSIKDSANSKSDEKDLKSVEEKTSSQSKSNDDFRRLYMQK